MGRNRLTRTKRRTHPAPVGDGGQSCGRRPPSSADRSGGEPCGFRSITARRPRGSRVHRESRNPLLDINAALILKRPLRTPAPRSADGPNLVYSCVRRLAVPLALGADACRSARQGKERRVFSLVFLRGLLLSLWINTVSAAKPVESAVPRGLSSRSTNRENTDKQTKLAHHLFLTPASPDPPLQ